MSSNNASGKVVSVDEQALKQADEAEVDADGFEVVEETRELRATVEQEIQAKVDANHPDGIKETNNERIQGATLEQGAASRIPEASGERDPDGGPRPARPTRRAIPRRAIERERADTAIEREAGWMDESGD